MKAVQESGVLALSLPHTDKARVDASVHSVASFLLLYRVLLMPHFSFEVFSLFSFFSLIAITLSLTHYNDNHDDERTNNFMMNDVSFHKAEWGPHRRHNTVSLVVWICRTLFFSFLSICVFTLLHLSFFRFCLWFSLLWLFSGGLMMNESMPYTQKEGVVFGEE